MKFYKKIDSGFIYRENEFSSKKESEYELLRGDESNEFNLMDIEQHLSSINKRVGWLLAIVVIVICLAILQALFMFASLM
jgi:hypothetical protein